MCICVNCHYVDRCLTYHMVETQHEQPHLTETP
ncbi:MAG: Ycf34 family protein, partial [Oscillatoria sp. Prado101]|nr:Ycf34 family protein [Oscillatoria sp. Prado101]